VRVNDIAKRQDLSVKYLERLIGELKRAGFIKSRRGPKGGHMLTRPVDHITIGEIVRVLEGGTEVIGCGDARTTCSRTEICLTRKAWLRAGQALYAELDSITVADLVQDARDCCGGCAQAPIPSTFSETKP
jgi:Rrf2 family protein